MHTVSVYLTQQPWLLKRSLHSSAEPAEQQEGSGDLYLLTQPVSVRTRTTRRPPQTFSLTLGESGHELQTAGGSKVDAGAFELVVVEKRGGVG